MVLIFLTKIITEESSLPWYNISPQKNTKMASMNGANTFDQTNKGKVTLSLVKQESGTKIEAFMTT